MTILHALELYLLLGVLFALVFVIRGASAIDPAAKEGSIGFRILIFPGSTVLWPWLAIRWMKSKSEREEGR